MSIRGQSAQNRENSLFNREFRTELGSLETASTATQYALLRPVSPATDIVRNFKPIEPAQETCAAVFRGCRWRIYPPRAVLLWRSFLNRRSRSTDCRAREAGTSCQ